MLRIPALGVVGRAAGFALERRHINNKADNDNDLEGLHFMPTRGGERKRRLKSDKRPKRVASFAQSSRLSCDRDSGYKSQSHCLGDRSLLPPSSLPPFLLSIQYTTAMVLTNRKRKTKDAPSRSQHGQSHRRPGRNKVPPSRQEAQGRDRRSQTPRRPSQSQTPEQAVTPVPPSEDEPEVEPDSVEDVQFRDLLWALDEGRGTSA